MKKNQLKSCIYTAINNCINTTINNASVIQKYMYKKILENNDYNSDDYSDSEIVDVPNRQNLRPALKNIFLAPDIMFSQAIENFNIWYKFWDEDFYNLESYKLFNQARKIYLREGKLSKIGSCFEYMIKCLEKSNKIKFKSLLGRNYEKYANFLIKCNRISLGLKYYRYAETIYLYHQIHLENIIKIKTIKRAIYLNYIENQVNDTLKHQLNNNELFNSCKETIQHISPHDVNSKIDLDITNKCLMCINNSKSQQQKMKAIYETMCAYVRLGNELTELNLKNLYGTYSSNHGK